MIPYFGKHFAKQLFGESLSGLDTKCGRCVQMEDMDQAVSMYIIRLRQKSGGGRYFLISYQLQLFMTIN